MKAAKFFLLWAPVAAWCALMYYLSGIPDLSTGLGIYDLILRKMAHGVEYAVLFLLFFRAARVSADFSPQGLLWAGFIFCVLYASSDEFHQSFVPGRYPSASDVMIDSFGAGLAAFYRMKFPGV